MLIDPRLTANLPAKDIAQRLNSHLRTHTNAVVTAPPGAGKSTLLPLTLLEAFGTDGKIIMLEPRRLAARQIAERMAAMIGEKVGETVGYRVRFESHVSAKTRIEVLTEGILTRMLVDDPTLEGVSVVIFDEFHERSLTSDLALALTREAKGLLRPDLRLVIMSATIDASSICKALDAKLIESEGRIYPVNIIHTPRETKTTDVESIARDAARTVLRAHKDNDGDILVFLPGQAEILRCQDLLTGAFAADDETHNTTIVCPLYGQLPPAEQQRAIAPSRDGERKIVLATNVAETSLTIEGVRIVVDLGLQRSVVVNQRTGLTSLVTSPISLDMAAQRTGRAGRVAEGVCYRMWSMADEHRMADSRTPEICEADLTPMILDVAAFGVNDVETLQWLTPPPHSNVMKASSLLRLLGATHEDGTITELGTRMASMPCHPRIGRMLCAAQTLTEKILAADIAALLEERDPMASSTNSSTSAEVDINSRIELMQRLRRRGQTGRHARLMRIAMEYRRMLRVGQHSSNTHKEELPTATIEANYTIDSILTGYLLALAYPERVAMAMDSAGHFRTASGDEANIEHSDALALQKWIVVASMNASNGRVFLASPIDTSHLMLLATKRNRLAWDTKRGELVAEVQHVIGTLVVDSRPLQPSRKDAEDALCEAARQYGRSMLSFNDDVQALQRRVHTIAQWHPELNLPDLSTDVVLAKCADWLPYYLDNNGRLRTSVHELRKIDLCSALWALLDYDQQICVDRLAPTHIVVPTGSRIRIDYRQGAEAPVLCVRLQECFGLTDTPCVDDGRRPVLMELLSPGYKPVQLTQDLRSFWQNTYYDVRKELRRRYPKHAWPDDPLTAVAVRK